jgi:hypothetical protein
VNGDDPITLFEKSFDEFLSERRNGLAATAATAYPGDRANDEQLRRASFAIGARFEVHPPRLVAGPAGLKLEAVLSGPPAGVPRRPGDEERAQHVRVTLFVEGDAGLLVYRPSGFPPGFGDRWPVGLIHPGRVETLFPVASVTKEKVEQYRGEVTLHVERFARHVGTLWSAGTGLRAFELWTAQRAEAVRRAAAKAEAQDKLNRLMHAMS